MKFIRAATGKNIRKAKEINCMYQNLLTWQ
jgi:hypothetical protein